MKEGRNNNKENREGNNKEKTDDDDDNIDIRDKKTDIMISKSIA